MRISRTKAIVGGLGAAILAAGIPALGQDKPESILPPDFDEPVGRAPAPAGPRARPSGEPTSSATGTPPPIDLTAGLGLPGDEPSPSPTPTETPTPVPQYQLPDFARRTLASVGVPVEGGLPANVFGAANGVFIEQLMRRLDAPIASRWLSIALRRALVAQVDTPPGVNGADFAAERAWLLLRMGESVAARGVVQSVDSEDYTPKLYQIAMQTALATGDPGELCPIADAGAASSADRAWVLAQGICAGLAGYPAKSTALLKAARKARVASGIDLLLAQKVAGAGAAGRQVVTIEWAGVSQLTAWRYGLASATGVAIPDDVLSTAGAQVTSWRAQSPTLDMRGRIEAAEQAAVRGVFSNAALVDLYSSIDPDDDQVTAAQSIARDLGVAYAGSTVSDRMDAIKRLWTGPTTPDARYTRLILTAHAAARVPRADNPEADRLVASMLSAGLDETALRWRGHVPAGGDAWAMLALADPMSDTAYTSGDIGGYKDSDEKRRIFFAGIAGLGRMNAAETTRGAEAYGVRLGLENAWTRAMDRAVRDDQPATVLLLSAIGMQTSTWQGVPPEALFRIVAALRAVGLQGEARMIAAEAIARL